MKVVGLITEYNPFHNGHKYHIEEAKRLTGADFAVIVMSGDFVQRGTPAIIDKYTRAEMALRNGVDLVLELPVCYATGSADFFARGAVSLLDKLGIVDFLCFGSESGDIKLLREAAQFLLETPEAFDDRLQAFLKDGLTYPAARAKALKHTLEAKEEVNEQALVQVLTDPNNILGIEYIKALLRFNSSIQPITIKRIAAGYHDIHLSEHPSQTAAYSMQSQSCDDLKPDNAVISSATAIRRAFQNQNKDVNTSFMQAKLSVPADVYQILQTNYLKTYPITEEDFSSIIKYKLLTEDKQALTGYVDINGDLAYRLKNITDFDLSISDLAIKIKT
ncbi:MAG: nucleotidyltransferase family protein, partial [Herbinix sp.]|nr:nucleotidyltransferase family protein [Herbinix sp.]